MPSCFYPSLLPISVLLPIRPFGLLHLPLTHSHKPANLPASSCNPLDPYHSCLNIDYTHPTGLWGPLAQLSSLCSCITHAISKPVASSCFPTHLQKLPVPQGPKCFSKHAWLVRPYQAPTSPLGPIHHSSSPPLLHGPPPPLVTDRNCSAPRKCKAWNNVLPLICSKCCPFTTSLLLDPPYTAHLSYVSAARYLPRLLSNDKYPALFMR